MGKDWRNRPEDVDDEEGYDVDDGDGDVDDDSDEDDVVDKVLMLDRSGNRFRLPRHIASSIFTVKFSYIGGVGNRVDSVVDNIVK